MSLAASDVWFTATQEALAAALIRLKSTDAVVLPLLSGPARRRLVRAAAGLRYRPARPEFGSGERLVRQEFELCTDFAPDSLFHACASALGRALDDALARLDPPPLARPFAFNDLIVQRYLPGVLGITPHRDHLRYVGLVALVTLSGGARFGLCDDRSGRGARPLTPPPGSLLLLRAPGFAGRRDRPFHYLSDVTEERVSLGLRQEAR